MRRTLVGMGLALAAVLEANGPVRADDNAKDDGKRMTVRGVIAGVTVEGETAIDYATHRAMTVEASFLTIVGSPVQRDATSSGNQSQATDRDRGGRHRHNVYVVWMTPNTEISDATGGGDTSGDRSKNQGGTPVRTSFDKIEVGDRVEVTLIRREQSNSAGGSPEAQRAARHGRHRTYFGNATSITILAMPGPASPGNTDRNRDDDKDKVKDSGK
jgi:hypothetical protein